MDFVYSIHVFMNLIFFLVTCTSAPLPVGLLLIPFVRYYRLDVTSTLVAHSVLGVGSS